MAEEDVPSTGQVLRMATTGGEATTPYGSRIGIIAVGKAADLVLIDWDKLAYPSLDPETSALDAVIQRAESDGVDLVMAAGEAKAGVSLGSTATRHCANCTNHCDRQSPTTRSSGTSCRRRSCPMSGASMPAISTPRRTCPTTARAHGFRAWTLFTRSALDAKAVATRMAGIVEGELARRERRLISGWGRR